MTSETPPELLIATEVAQWLRLKCSTTYAWAASGKIPSVRLNGTVRFIRAEIQRWLNDRSNSPADSPPSVTRSIIQPKAPSVSRHALQQAGARAIRRVTDRQPLQQNLRSGTSLPTDIAEARNDRA
jgi:excisionase family DNA binding protein